MNDEFAARVKTLTEKRLAVLRLLLKGKPNKVIARELGLGADAVKDHVGVLLRTCGASSRTEAVYNVVRAGGLDALLAPPIAAAQTPHCASVGSQTPGLRTSDAVAPPPEVVEHREALFPWTANQPEEAPVSGDNNEFASRYLRELAEIEQAEKELARRRQNAMKIREEEKATAIHRIRKEIIALGITSEELYPRAVPAKQRQRGVRSDSGMPRPPKYALDGKTWSGLGHTPEWFSAALRRGMSREDLLIKVDITHPNGSEARL